MKKYFYFASAFAALALASCSSDDFLNEVPNEPVAKQELITFSSDNNRNARGVVTGKDAADLLNNNFVVYATKGTTPSVVMDNYNLNWKGAASAGSSDTNPKGWEYAGYTSKQGAQQDAKYWDYKAEQYDFVAVSGLAATEKITSTTAGFKVKVTDPAQMTNIYFADRVSAKPTAAAATATTPEYKAYKDVITFQFRRLNAKMRVGFYETIPGYAVRNLKFYYTTAASGSGVVGMGGDYPVSGEYEITYDAQNKAHAKFDASDASYKHHRYNTFGRLAYTVAPSKAGDAATKPYIGTDGAPTATPNPQFLSTSASAPTWAIGKYTVDHVDNVETAWKPILPYEDNEKEITLRVNYELVSLDGSKETIYVRNATAKVPVEYCKWQPNYAYTYLFKITDNSNGTTTPDPGVDPDPDTPDPGTPDIPDPNDPDDPDGPDPDPDPSDPDNPDNPDPGIPDDPNAGLYPITFDACVVTETSVEETITTVATPSITTHAAGSDVVGNDEYKVGEKIVLSVPAGYTPLAWEFVKMDNALTELNAETQDKAGKIAGWTGLGGNVLTPTAAGYYVVRMTYHDGTNYCQVYKVIKVNA